MSECVSIIVPIYNVEAFLKPCVDSLINQTYRNLEIILVDDGATDSSGAIADSLAATDDRIKVIHQKNGGLSAARNTGLDNCKGDYICFVDSDDYVKDTYVEELLDACRANNVKMAMCLFYRVLDGKEVLKNPQKKGEVISAKEACLRYMEQSYEVVWNKIYKSELFSNVRFPVGRIHEDVATTYKCFWKSGSVAVIYRELYAYRTNSSGITGSKYTERRYDEIRAVKEGLAFFEDKEEDVYKNFLVIFFTRAIAHLNVASKTEDLKGRYFDNLQKEALDMLQVYKKRFGSSSKLGKFSFGVKHPRAYSNYYKCSKSLKKSVKKLIGKK